MSRHQPPTSNISNDARVLQVLSELQGRMAVLENRSTPNFQVGVTPFTTTPAGIAGYVFKLSKPWPNTHIATCAWVAEASVNYNGWVKGCLAQNLSEFDVVYITESSQNVKFGYISFGN